MDGWIGTGIARLCGAINLINPCFSSGTGCPAEPLVGTLAGKLKFPTTRGPCLAEEAIGIIDDAVLTLVLEWNGILLFDYCKRKSHS